MAEKEIITRAQAKELGLARYYTGRPCVNGHVAERETASWTCVACRMKESTKYKAAHRRKFPLYPALVSSRRRARRRGIPHELTKENIPPIPDTCPYYGIPLQKAKGISAYNSPSLDRIVPSLGYVPGNVEWISKRANTHKNDSTVEEMQMMLARRIKMRDEA